MSFVSNMVIPPKAVSRLFGACANASEGADCPSLFDFGANFTIRAGSKYLNWVARAENNGGLSGLPGGAEARNKERQEEYERYIAQLWLSRMSEEYQRSYYELMKTLDDAEDFCKNAQKEIARRIEWADRELDDLQDRIVMIDGEECFIRNGVLVGRDGVPSKLSKEKQDEAWRAYATDPKRKAAAERGGQIIDFREKNKELSAEVTEHGNRARETRELAGSKGMTREELEQVESEIKQKTRLLKEELNREMMTEVKNTLPAKSFDRKQSVDLDVSLDDDYSGEILDKKTLIGSKEPDLAKDVKDRNLSVIFLNNTTVSSDTKMENNVALARSTVLKAGPSVCK